MNLGKATDMLRNMKCYEFLNHACLFDRKIANKFMEMEKESKVN